MIAALPGAISEKVCKSDIFLSQAWEHLESIRYFDINPHKYSEELNLAKRKGTLAVVKKIIKESI